jgi:hypothetical protein
MTDWKIFDHYSLRACLQPALLTLLPAALAVIAWTGPSRPWMSALWALFGTAGGTYFLAILARNQGKQFEQRLWQSWGGAPTTQLLRRSGQANPVLRERWHKCLAKLVGKAFPTAQEEVADPTVADQLYEAGIKLLINKTRAGKKFPLVYKENVQYGFCRNLYAMKTTGIIISFLSTVVSCAAGIWLSHNDGPQMIQWICMATSALFLFWWIFKVKSDWVKVPAFAYAERLLESTENISRARNIKRVPEEQPGKSN